MSNPSHVKEHNRAEAYATGIAIFCAALALRLLHLWQLRHSPFFQMLLGDARGYDEWAQRIAAGEWIGRDVFYQAPLYPYFLAVIYRVAGHSLMLVRVVQAVIGSCSCVLVAAAARRFFSDRAGLVAGLILAVYAPAIFFDGLIQKSVLDVLFVSLMLWLIAEITTQSRGWEWLALGLTVGGLSLSRENAAIFVLVLAGWALLRFGIRPAAVFALGVVLVLLPVTIRNSVIGGGFYITSSQFGTNLYIGNHAGTDGTYQSLRYGRGAPEYERQDATDLAELAVSRKLTPSQVSSFWTDKALAFVTSQPGAWLKVMTRKVLLLGNATEMIDTEDQSSYAEWSTVLRVLGPFTHFGVLVPLALVGIVATWQDRPRLWILFTLLITYSASVLLFYVFARYRYPLVPILILYVAAGLSFMATRSKAAMGWSVAKIAALAAITVLCNWPIASANAMRAVTETNLGTAFQTEGRLQEALDHYRRAIAADNDYAPAFSNLATVLREQKRTAEAAANYQEALKRQPDFASAHYNLANLLLEQGDNASAVDHFERAIRNEPASADVHNNFGIALMSLSRVDEATREFRQAVELDPSSAKANRNLADALSTQGRSAEAISALRHAVELAPNDPSAHYDLASELLGAGSLDQAIPEFRTTLRLAPAQAGAHNNLGIALGSQGKLDEAIDEFRRALDVQPDFTEARQNLAMALAARRSGVK